MITHELAARQMGRHLSAALDALEKAEFLAPDDWDKAHIEKIRSELEGLVVDVNEEMA